MPGVILESRRAQILYAYSGFGDFGISDHIDMLRNVTHRVISAFWPVLAQLPPKRYTYSGLASSVLAQNTDPPPKPTHIVVSAIRKVTESPKCLPI